MYFKIKMLGHEWQVDFRLATRTVYRRGGLVQGTRGGGVYMLPRTCISWRWGLMFKLWWGNATDYSIGVDPWRLNILKDGYTPTHLKDLVGG